MRCSVRCSGMAGIDWPADCADRIARPIDHLRPARRPASSPTDAARTSCAVRQFLEPVSQTESLDRIRPAWPTPSPKRTAGSRATVTPDDMDL